VAGYIAIILIAAARLSCASTDGTGKVAFGALTASVDGGFTPAGSTSIGTVPMKAIK
jgi:hypothetical protein